MLLMYSVLRCLYSVGDKITTTSGVPGLNFINGIFYFIKDGNICIYAQDYWVTVHHKKWTTSNDIFQNVAKSGGLKSIPCKLSRINCRYVTKRHLKFGWFRNNGFVSEIIVYGICIDEQLHFNAHVERICTWRQVGALQRLTGVLDYDSRLAI